MDLSMLFSNRLLNRKIKVHPQKCTENYTENTETNKTILNTRPKNFLSLNEQQKSKYLSYEEVVFPSHPSSLKQQQLHQDHTQEDKPISSCDLSRSEENINILQQQKDLLERVEVSNDMSPPKVARKELKKNLFDEIKNICFKLVGKIDVFKIMTRNKIVKDHWKEDSTTKCCSFCNRKFTMFFRKHHCRICGNIYCSSCSSGRTLLDPTLAIPAQFVSVTTSNKSVKYNRDSGGFEFDGFEYNYLDHEEYDQEQQEHRHYEREHEQYLEYQRQNQRLEYDYELYQDNDYEQDQYKSDQEFDEEFDENYMGDMNDEYSLTDCSDYSNSDSSSLVDFNNCTCEMIYNDDDSLTVNNSDDITCVSEPVRERICINCHKMFELDEKDWLL